MRSLTIATTIELMTLALAVTSAQAVPITVPNGGFESDVLGDGGID